MEVRMGRRYLNVIQTILLFLIAGCLLNCGEPLEPAAPAWVREANFPADVGQVFAIHGWGPQWIIAAQSTDDRAVILKYQRPSFETVFISPHENSLFEDIGRDDRIWAGGTKEVNGKQLPYIVISAPEQAPGELLGWREIELPATAYSTVCRIVPTSGVDPPYEHEICWLLLSNHSRRMYGKKAGYLALYRDGDLTVFNQLGPVTLISASSCNVTAVEYAGDNTGRWGGHNSLGPGYSGRGRIFSTYDFGASWRTEYLPENIGGRRVHAAEAIHGDYGGPCLLVYFDDLSISLVNSSRHSKNLVYSISFLSYWGPYFQDLRCFASSWINDGVHTGAIGCGPFTTIVRKGGQWYIEPMNSALDIKAVVDCIDGGYVGVAANQTFGGYELIYHP